MSQLLCFCNWEVFNIPGIAATALRLCLLHWKAMEVSIINFKFSKCFLLKLINTEINCG